MKFIVDAQLPKRLYNLLLQLGADCIHTLDLPQNNRTPDNLIIEYSEINNCIVITKDRDFLQSYLIFKRPRKLLLVNTGNIHNNELILLFQRHYTFIAKQFEVKNLMTLNKDEIVVHE